MPSQQDSSSNLSLVPYAGIMDIAWELEGGERDVGERGVEIILEMES